MVILEKDESELINTYFIRHTDILAISPEAVSELYSQDKIFIHYPDCIDDPEKPDNESLNPNDYYVQKKSAPPNINKLNELSYEGGVVWAEYYIEQKFIKIGVVLPKTEPKLEKKYRWENEKLYPNSKGKQAVLKVIQMQNVKEIERSELMSLLVSRPRQGTLRGWHAIGDKLKSIYYKKPLKKDFSSLTPPEQEIACLEFLRNQKLFSDIPQLRYLLLPPGRTMESVDIYGLSNDNKKIFAQVTYLGESKDTELETKKEKLRNLSNLSNDQYLIFFYNSPTIYKDEDIICIPITEVERWLNQPEQKNFTDKLFETINTSHGGV